MNFLQHILAQRRAHVAAQRAATNHDALREEARAARSGKSPHRLRAALQSDGVNIIAEFAGLSAGMGLFGVSKYIVVPIGAFLVWFVVVHNSYRPVERVLIIFSAVFFVYPVSALLAHPNWHLALRDTFVPTVTKNSEYLVMVIGMVGTTITPWMQFYLQASVVEKGIGKRQ